MGLVEFNLFDGGRSEERRCDSSEFRVLAAHCRLCVENVEDVRGGNAHGPGLGKIEKLIVLADLDELTSILALVELDLLESRVFHFKHAVGTVLIILVFPQGDQAVLALCIIVFFDVTSVLGFHLRESVDCAVLLLVVISFDFFESLS
jgi:hypothetical protein